MKTSLFHRATSSAVLLATTVGLIVIDPGLLGMRVLSSGGGAALAQDAEEATNVRVYQQAGPAVVSIETAETTGSGSIVSADGLILTNAHVVGSASTVTVTLADGREFQGDVVAFGEPGLDLAAVKIRSQEQFPFVRIAAPNSVQVGQRAFAIGNPFGRFQGTLTIGIVSRVDRDRGLIQTDAAINPGNSGGALLNSRGELIGINTTIFVPSGSAGNIGIGFAIPVDRIQPFLTAVREGRASRTAQQQTRPGLSRAPQPLDLGSSVQGRLTVESNVFPGDNSYFDAYTFTGRAGQRVDITMSSRQIDAYLILLDPEGRDVAQDDDSAGGTNSRIVATLPVSGTYTIFANSYGEGEVGAYNLQLAIADSRTATAAPARPAVATGMLLREEGLLDATAPILQSDGSRYKEHAFTGRVGQSVTITLESSDFDTYLIVVGPDNQILGENDDIGPDNYNSSITLTLPANGTYRIIANAFDAAGQGRYLLTVR